ncbi:MAG: hypothetical protein RIS69_1149 [Actinomycetota bacterium]
MDRASDFGSDGWEFESLRAHLVVFAIGTNETSEMSPKSVNRVAVAIGAFVTLAGVMHFINAKFFNDIVPPWLPPSESFWTYVSGVAELIVGRVGGNRSFCRRVSSKHLHGLGLAR